MAEPCLPPFHHPHEPHPTNAHCPSASSHSSLSPLLTPPSKHSHSHSNSLSPYLGQSTLTSYLKSLSIDVQYPIGEEEAQMNEWTKLDMLHMPPPMHLLTLQILHYTVQPVSIDSKNNPQMIVLSELNNQRVGSLDEVMTRADCQVLAERTLLLTKINLDTFNHLFGDAIQRAWNLVQQELKDSTLTVSLNKSHKKDRSSNFSELNQSVSHFSVAAMGEKRVDLEIFRSLCLPQTDYFLFPAVALEPIGAGTIDCTNNLPQFIAADHLDWVGKELVEDYLKREGERWVDQSAYKTIASTVQKQDQRCSSNQRFSRLLGTKAVLPKSQQSYLWTKFSCHEVEAIIFGSFGFMLDEINITINLLNSKSLDRQFMPFRSSDLFKLGALRSQDQENPQLCIPLRHSSNRQSVLVRIISPKQSSKVNDLESGSDKSSGREGREVRWVKANRLLINYNLPTHSHEDRQYYCLLGPPLSLLESLLNLYNPFYGYPRSFERSLQAVFPTREQSESMTKLIRCCKCSYVIDGQQWRCKFCQNYWDSECAWSHSILENSSGEPYWSCGECLPCELCGRSVAGDRQKCHLCGKYYHFICGSIRVPSPYVQEYCSKFQCYRCAQCRKCGIELVDELAGVNQQRLLCQSCLQLQKVVPTCAVCCCSLTGLNRQYMCPICTTPLHCDQATRAAPSSSIGKIFCIRCFTLQKRKIMVNIIHRLKVFDQGGFFNQPTYKKLDRYLQTIPNPICLLEMRLKVLRGVYDCSPHSSLLGDFNTLCDNALDFNMPKEYPHYRAKTLKVIGNGFIQRMKPLLEMSRSELRIQHLASAYHREEVDFFRQLQHRYAEMLLQFNSSLHTRVIYSQQDRDRLSKVEPNIKRFDSQQYLQPLEKAHFEISIDLKSISICDFLSSQKVVGGAQGKVSQQQCFFHPRGGQPIVYQCSQCWQTYCCIRYCLLHRRCQRCGQRGCGCDRFRCGCHLSLEECRQGARQLSERVKRDGLGVREMTQYFKYCYRCAIRKYESNICYYCNQYCFYGYENCIQCKKTFHFRCQDKFSQRKSINSSVPLFGRSRLPQLCRGCSTTQKNMGRLYSYCEQHTQQQLFKQKNVLHYYDCLKVMFEQQGLPSSKDEVTSLLTQPVYYQMFTQQSHMLELFKDSLDQIKSYLAELYLPQAIQTAPRVLSLSENLTVQQTVEQIIKVPTKYSIFEDEGSEEIIKQWDVRFTLQELFSPFYQFDTWKLYRYQRIERGGLWSNAETVEKIRWLCLTQYICRPLIYTSILLPFHTNLSTSNSQPDPYFSSNICFISEISFLLSHQDFSLDTVCFSLPRGGCLLPQIGLLSNATYKPYRQYRFDQPPSFLAYDQESLKEIAPAFQLAVEVYEMSFHFLERIKLQEMQALRRGNTCILSSTKNYLKVIKYLGHKMFEITLQKEGPTAWELSLGPKKYHVKSLSDVLREVSRIAPAVTDIERLMEFLGVNIGSPPYLSTDNVSGRCNYAQLSKLNTRRQRRKYINKVLALKDTPEKKHPSKNSHLHSSESSRHPSTDRSLFFLKKPNEKLDHCQTIKQPFLSIKDLYQDISSQLYPSFDESYSIKNEPLINSVFVGPSRIHKIGLFASSHIPKDSTVIEYVGQTISATIADLREKRGQDICYLFGVGEREDGREQVIDATFVGNMSRYINHSCQPNCKASLKEMDGKRRLFIYTIRDVMANEELTYDYQFQIESQHHIQCTCGSLNCQHRLN